MSNRSSHFVRRFQTLPSALAGVSGSRKLLALAAVLALLAVTLQPTVGQALAQTTEVWAATMTVGRQEVLGTPIDVWGYSQFLNYGSLDDTDFTIGPTTHTVQSLNNSPVTLPNKVTFVLDNALADDDIENLELRIGTSSFRLSDAAASTTPGGNVEYLWISTLTLTVGDMVAVSLSTLPPPDTTPPTLESATVLADGASIDLVFDEVCDFDAALGFTTTAFSVTADGSPVTYQRHELPQGFSDFTILNLEDLSPAITHGQVVTVSYIDPTTGDDTSAVLEDATGNDVASFTTGSSGVPAVVNNVPDPNAPPEFTSAASFSAPENQTDVGTVRATDEDAGDTVSYAITGGADQARFDIDASSGILTFKDAPDHENPTDAGGNNTYMVTVTATSGTGDRAMTVEQSITVTVTDVVEIPAVVSVVVTSSPGTGTDTYGQGQPITVTVTFDQAVRVTGTPRIQLRVGGSDPATHLKWANYVGGSGSAALRFTYRVQAADMDSNGIYIEADELELNSGTIQGVDDDVAANLNYPRQGAQSGHKVDGSLVGTRPSAPAPPWVQALDSSTSALDVRWIEPADSVVESYDLRYRKGGSGDWEDGPQDVADTRSEITGLESGASYEVRVRATNRRGDSEWSASTTGYPATVYDIDGIYIYWTEQQGSEKLHDDVADLGSSMLENACDTGESFRAWWLQPLESRNADEWEADVQTIEGTGTAQYTLRTAPELTGAVALDGFTIIAIRIRGRFGENWSNWSRAVNLICVPTEDDSGSATGNSSTGSENATSNPLAGFELVDATAHLDAGAVEDGATLTGIDPAKVYGFRVNVASGAELKSVKIELSGPGPDDRVTRKENYKPYSLYGDSEGHEHGAALPAGSYTLTATAYSEKDGGGNQLGTLSIEVTVAGGPLTARFEGLPEAGHGGAGTPFTFRIVFSEAVTTTPEGLRDHALEVTNATVEAVSRVDERNDLWEVRLTPGSDATVTVSLSAATDCDAAGAVCTEDGRMLSHGVARAIVAQPPNTSATGAPAISGTAQVGQTLTADTSAIADENGLVNVSYSYQWLADDADISGANGSTYTLTASEQGKTISVTVSFTDDAGHEESRTSAATSQVAPPPPGRPQNLAGQASQQEIQLTWSAPEGSVVTQYVVYRGKLQDGSMNGQPMTKYATIDATGEAMAYTDASVESGVEYRYRVAAVNSTGEGGKSPKLDIAAIDSTP